MFATIAKFLTRFAASGALDRVLSAVDRRVNSETERERIKAETIQAYMSAQVKVLTGPGWWFPLFFIAPLGLWWASVCIYSVLFCQDCAFPQEWSIAALPYPLDEWAGIMIGSLFIGRIGQQIIERWR